VAAVLGGAGLLLAVPFAIVTVPVSVWVGRLSRRDRPWLWVVAPLNAVAAILVFFGIVVAGSGLIRDSSPSAGARSTYEGLWQDSDRQILDIRPVDAFGNPLTNMYLFDQDGQPIDASDNCFAGYGAAMPTTTAARPYPRGTVDYDPATGRCVVTPPGPLVVAVPTPTAVPTR